MTALAKRVAIYARVSTKDQDPENQLLELRELAARRGWTVTGEYVDHGVSGAKDRRPQLDAMVDVVRRRKADIVLVWALDRLGRSLRHLVDLAGVFEVLEVDLVCLNQPIDTTTPAGRLTFAVLGACAQFEREMIRDRVKAGLANARAKGRKLGRPRASVDLAHARARLAAGASLRAVAREVDVAPSTLAKLLAETPAAVAS